MENAENPGARLRLSELQPNTPLEGTVQRLELFGAFVDVGAEREGLVHISMLRREPVNRVEDVVQVGQKVKVWVHSVDPFSGRFELTMIRPLLLKWKDIHPGLRQKGTVVKVEKFGAFVDIGAERPGLVHVSEMSNEYVPNPAALVKEGDEVDVVVLDRDRTKRQIRLSMKQAEAQEEVAEGEAEAEDKPAPTAMEFALRRAMEQGESQAPQAERSERQPRRSTRAAQEDILARTLKQRVK